MYLPSALPQSYRSAVIKRTKNNLWCGRLTQNPTPPTHHHSHTPAAPYNHISTSITSHTKQSHTTNPLTQHIVHTRHIHIHIHTFNNSNRSIHSNNATSTPASPSLSPTSPNTYDDEHNIPLNKRIEVIYGDWKDNFIIINKPSNLVIQSQTQDNICTRIHQYYGKPVNEIFFPHRIDKHTNGLLIIAFDSKTCSTINKFIQNNQIQRNYRVIAQLPPYITASLLHASSSTSNNHTHPHPSLHHHAHHYNDLISPHLHNHDGLYDTQTNTLKTEGTLRSMQQRRPLPKQQRSIESISSEVKKWYATRLPCGCIKSHNSSLSYHQQRRLHPFIPETLLHQSTTKVGYSMRFNNNGKNITKKPRESVTHYKLLSVSENKEYALYDVSLVTGRTHQIRIHFSDAACPLVNDIYYNPYYIMKFIQGYRSSGADDADNNNEGGMRSQQHQSSGDTSNISPHRTNPSELYNTAVSHTPLSSAMSYQYIQTSSFTTYHRKKLMISEDKSEEKHTNFQSVAKEDESSSWESVLQRYGVRRAKSSGDDTITHVASQSLPQHHHHHHHQQGVEESKTPLSSSSSFIAGARGWLTMGSENRGVKGVSSSSSSSSNMNNTNNQSEGGVAEEDDLYYGDIQHNMMLQSYSLQMPHPTMPHTHIELELPIPGEWKTYL